MTRRDVVMFALSLRMQPCPPASSLVSQLLTCYVARQAVSVLSTVLVTSPPTWHLSDDCTHISFNKKLLRRENTVVQANKLTKFGFG